MDKPVSRTTLINITLLVEAFLLLAATVWSHLQGIELLKPLMFNYRALLIGVAVGVIMSLAGFALYELSRRFPIFPGIRNLIDEYMLPMVAELKGRDLGVIAVVSGFCEEIFFRGVAQAVFGPILTSIAFGLFHDPTFRHISYALIATMYGLLLAFLYQFTGNLWAPIVAHIVHNWISLYILRYRIKPPATPVQNP